MRVTQPMALRRQAAGGVRWTGFATLVATAGQFVQLVVLGRLLDPQAFGLMAMVLIVIGFVQTYTDLGMSGALVFRRDATDEQLSSLYWLNVGMGLLAMLLVLSTAPLAARLFGEPRVVPLLRALAVTFAISAAGRQIEVLLQRDFAFRVIALVDVVAVVGGTCAAVATALAGGGVWALVAGVLAHTVLKAVMLVAAGWRAHGPRWHFRFADARSFIGFGAYQVGERAINFLGERADQMLLGGMLGASVLGHYGFAHNLVSQPVSRLNPIVTRVAFPAFALIRDDPARLRRGFVDVTRVLVTVNAPLLLGLVAVAPSLIPFVFGEHWTPSVPLVQLLGIVALSRTIGNPVGSLLLACGRADLGFRWNVLVVALTLPTIFAGAHYGGAVGVAVSLILLQSALQLMSYFLLVRPVLGRMGVEYAAAILSPLALGAVMALLVAALPLLLTSLSMLESLLLQVFAGVLTYGSLLALFARGSLRDMRTLVASRA